jgi:hypothetical protein
MLNPDAIRPKHATAKFYIGFKLKGLADGETITSCTATVSPVGLTLSGAVSIDAALNKISQFIQGGTAGVDYTVRFHYGTSAGNEDDLDYLVEVIA